MKRASDNPDEKLIELSNVCLKSDRDEMIFRDMDFSLRRGESAVITGPAGAGKTSLVELLIGTRFADSGLVALFGHEVAPRKRSVIKKIRRRIGGVGGVFGLIPTYTVAENIVYPLILAGMEKRDRLERLFAMLTEFSLLKQSADYPDHLTRVERALVQFARATVADQPLVLIDEPLAGLDTQTYERIFEYLVKVSLSGRSMLILTSDVPARELPRVKNYNLGKGILT